MTQPTLWAALVVPLLFAAACTVDNSESTVRWLKYSSFKGDVQQVLSDKCGNPSCHGRADRPFSIYAPLNWRLDPERTFLTEPLSDEELRHNYTSSCVFVTEAEEPEDALLLRKPLGETADLYHGGGAIFEGTTDRDYRILLFWIQEGW